MKPWLHRVRCLMKLRSVGGVSSLRDVAVVVDDPDLLADAESRRPMSASSVRLRSSQPPRRSSRSRVKKTVLPPSGIAPFCAW